MFFFRVVGLAVGCERCWCADIRCSCVSYEFLPWKYFHLQLTLCFFVFPPFFSRAIPTVWEKARVISEETNIFSNFHGKIKNAILKWWWEHIKLIVTPLCVCVCQAGWLAGLAGGRVKTKRKIPHVIIYFTRSDHRNDH